MGRRGSAAGPDRGSALLLFPVGVVIVFVLAAMAVDLSAAFLAQRELHDATAAAAADAATALGRADFYDNGRVSLDPASMEGLARARVTAAVDARRHHGLEVQVSIAAPSAVGCAATVTVSASSTLDPIFAAALGGGSRRTPVRASSSARPEQSAGPSAC